jgi:hypothetical protein
MEILPCGEDVVVARRSAGPDAMLAIVRLRHAGRVDLTGMATARRPTGRSWCVALDTEDSEFAVDGTRPRVDLDGPAVEFARAGAVLFTARATLPTERAS